MCENCKVQGELLGLVLPHCPVSKDRVVRLSAYERSRLKACLRYVLTDVDALRDYCTALEGRLSYRNQSGEMTGPGSDVVSVAEVCLSGMAFETPDDSVPFAILELGLDVLSDLDLVRLSASKQALDNLVDMILTVNDRDRAKYWIDPLMASGDRKLLAAIGQTQSERGLETLLAVGIVEYEAIESQLGREAKQMADKLGLRDALKFISTDSWNCAKSVLASRHLSPNIDRLRLAMTQRLLIEPAATAEVIQLARNGGLSDSFFHVQHKLVTVLEETKDKLVMTPSNSAEHDALLLLRLAADAEAHARYLQEAGYRTQTAPFYAAFSEIVASFHHAMDKGLYGREPKSHEYHRIWLNATKEQSVVKATEAIRHQLIDTARRSLGPIEFCRLLNLIRYQIGSMPPMATPTSIGYFQAMGSRSCLIVACLAGTIPLEFRDDRFDDFLPVLRNVLAGGGALDYTALCDDDEQWKQFNRVMSERKTQLRYALRDDEEAAHLVTENMRFRRVSPREVGGNLDLPNATYGLFCFDVNHPAEVDGDKPTQVLVTTRTNAESQIEPASEVSKTDFDELRRFLTKHIAASEVTPSNLVKAALNRMSVKDSWLEILQFVPDVPEKQAVSSDSQTSANWRIGEQCFSFRVRA